MTATAAALAAADGAVVVVHHRLVHIVIAASQSTCNRLQLGQQILRLLFIYIFNR